MRVYWPGDDAWYLGQVKSYCEATGKHKARLGRAGLGGGWPFRCIQRHHATLLPFGASPPCLVASHTACSLA